MSRTALSITSLAAAFVLVLIGGVVSWMSTSPAAPEPIIAQPTVSPSGPAAEPPMDPATARFEEREREYRARLDEANERLRAQQAALDEARRRLRQTPDVVPPRPSPEHRERGEHGREGDDEERHHRAEHEEREHGRYAFAMRRHHDDDED
jgi:hypothetical protein